jgi:hypothetical protein
MGQLDLLAISMISFVSCQTQWALGRPINPMTFSIANLPDKNKDKAPCAIAARAETGFLNGHNG